LPRSLLRTRATALSPQKPNTGKRITYKSHH
jgi:hypothetical protein